jgi:hypothetical protein
MTNNAYTSNADLEMFRTPASAFLPLLDYRPEWFQGSGFDPSAGDGRMLGEVIRRGNVGPHHLNDVRQSEIAKMAELLGVAATCLDYLVAENLPCADFMITNTPVKVAQQFVTKAKSHIDGPICVLQPISWQATAKRSVWLREAGLAYVLNLMRRPSWEIDGSANVPNACDFAWFVFLPDQSAPTVMDWI